jgi:hypothetical protein
MSSKASQRSELAHSALAEFVSAGYGEQVSEQELEKGVFEVSFRCTERAYQGWNWVVTLTQIDGRSAPSVSEINLIAGENALLAPPWVPWAERLAEFRSQLRAEGKANSDAEADALIRDMVGSAHGDEAEDAEAYADQASVQPPVKTRVRKRLVKREHDDESQDPQGDSDN